MNVLEGSLAYRALRPAWRWLHAASRDSLMGRFFLAVVGVVTTVASDSESLGTRRSGSRLLDRTDRSISLRVIAVPYLWLRRVVGGGGFAKAVRASETGFARSALARGHWVTVLGAGIYALGVGRLALLFARGITTVDNTGLPVAAPEVRLIAPVIVLLVGLLMLLTGPRLVDALSGGMTGRVLAFIAGRPIAASAWGITSTGWARSDEWVTGIAAALATVAGVAGGATSGSGPTVLVLLVLVIWAFVLVLFRPEALLIAVAVFPWLDWAARQVLGGAGPLWDEAMLIASMLLLLWCVLVLRRWDVWTVPVTLPVVLAFVVALGSVVVNQVPGDVGFYALRILFEPMLFYFLGFLFPKDRGWLRATVIVFVLTSCSLALHGLYQYLTHAPMPASWVDVQETGIGTRAYSIIQNPNGLGAFLLMGTLISVSLALSRHPRRAPRLLWGLAAVVQLAGLAVTFSRGAWIGLAVGVLVLVVIAYRRYLVPIVGAAVLAWFFAPRAFVNRLTFAFSSAYITKSSEAGRLYVWRMALDYAGKHPWFGVGLGTFGGTSAVTFGYGRLWVDNFYLQLAAEGGIVLLAFFLWILLRAIKGLVRGYGVAEDRFLRALSGGMIAAFVAVAMANVTASVWETLTVGVGFWFLTGLVTSAALHQGAVPGERAS